MNGLKRVFFQLWSIHLACFTLVSSQLCFWWNSDLFWPPVHVCRSKIKVFKILENIQKMDFKNWLFWFYNWVLGVKIGQNFTRNTAVIIPKWNKLKWMLQSWKTAFSSEKSVKKSFETFSNCHATYEKVNFFSAIF